MSRPRIITFSVSDGSSPPGSPAPVSPAGPRHATEQTPVESTETELRSKVIEQDVDKIKAPDTNSEVLNWIHGLQNLTARQIKNEVVKIYGDNLSKYCHKAMENQIKKEVNKHKNIKRKLETEIAYECGGQNGKKKILCSSKKN
jgi:hypothetical protein